MKYHLLPSATKAARNNPKGLKEARKGADSKFTDFDIILGTAANQTALAPGTLQKRWTTNNRNYFHFIHFETIAQSDFGGSCETLGVDLMVISSNYRERQVTKKIVAGKSEEKEIDLSFRIYIYKKLFNYLIINIFTVIFGCLGKPINKEIYL